MDKKDQLRAMIDAVIKDDAEAMKLAFQPYVKDMSKDILGYSKDETEEVQSVTESVLLKEMADALHDSPIKIQGDNIVVNGKIVGVVQSDPTDFDSGINYIEDGGKFSKEFNTVEEFFKFIADKYCGTQKEKA